MKVSGQRLSGNGWQALRLVKARDEGFCAVAVSRYHVILTRLIQGSRVEPAARSSQRPHLPGPLRSRTCRDRRW